VSVNWLNSRIKKDDGGVYLTMTSGASSISFSNNVLSYCGFGDIYVFTGYPTFTLTNPDSNWLVFKTGMTWRTSFGIVVYSSN
jgi:hypothetical protein